MYVIFNCCILILINGVSGLRRTTALFKKLQLGANKVENIFSNIFLHAFCLLVKC